MPTKVKPIPEQYGSITPYLITHDTAGAIEFYKRAFGATELFRMPAPDGRVGHAELRFGDRIVMLADEYPDIEALSPKSVGGSPVGLMLYVEDVDAVFAKAVSEGAKVRRALENKFYGDRTGTLVDPYGHVWHVGTHVEDVSPEEMEKRAAAMV